MSSTENPITSKEISGLAIVLVGDFNPAIFQPLWFSSQNLIPATEAREAKELVVHSELTVFKLPWVKIQVTHKQFVASSMQESHFEPARDLVIGLFSLLNHCPVQKLGINSEWHYKFSDTERYREFGHKLAPKEVWRKTMKDPGLLQMNITDPKRDDGYAGYIQVNLEASILVKPGVYFRVNDHFEWPTEENKSGVETALKIVSSEFQKSLDRSQKIIESVLTIA